MFERKKLTSVLVQERVQDISGNLIIDEPSLVDTSLREEIKEFIEENKQEKEENKLDNSEKRKIIVERMNNWIKEIETLDDDSFFQAAEMFSSYQRNTQKLLGTISRKRRQEKQTYFPKAKKTRSE